MRLAVCIAVVILIPAVVNAQTTWYIPDNFTTIQGGISDASVVNGDSIIVRPGTYVENINFVGKAITLKSELGPDVTVIDGNQAGSVVTFNSGEIQDSILDGFLLKNGSGNLEVGAYIGGGIFCETASPTIVNNIISYNTADNGGGLVCFNKATPTIDTNVIAYNVSNYEGGGINCYDSNVSIVNNIISNNTSNGVGGGGIFCNKSDATISNNEITVNKTNYAGALGGGGIFIWRSSPLIIQNDISNNSSNGNGGGLFCESKNTVEIIDNNVSSNIADGAGGGIYYYTSSGPGGSLTIDNNIISKNESQTGGGINICTSVTQGCSATIKNNIIDNNIVNQSGGGIYGHGESIIILSNIITNNKCGKIPFTTNPSGGGMEINFDESYVINNIITYNSAGTGGNFGRGGGIVTYGSKDLIVNNTICYNETVERGGGIYCVNATLSNSILWGNVAQTGPEINEIGGATVTYCDIKGGWPGTGNIDSDPLFIDLTNNDFHIKYTSPCRDAGDNSVITELYDFEGDPRIADGTVDMGVDEFHSHLYFTGNATPTGDIDLKFIGIPGTLINGLILGVNIFDPPLPCDYGLWYVDNPFQIMTGFGTITADGVKVFPSTIPASTPSPMTVYLQAAIDSWLTNSCPVQVQ